MFCKAWKLKRNQKGIRRFCVRLAVQWLLDVRVYMLPLAQWLNCWWSEIYNEDKSPWECPVSYAWLYPLLDIVRRSILGRVVFWCDVRYLFFNMLHLSLCVGNMGIKMARTFEWVIVEHSSYMLVGFFNCFLWVF